MTVNFNNKMLNLVNKSNIGYDGFLMFTVIGAICFRDDSCDYSDGELASEMKMTVAQTKEVLNRLLENGFVVATDEDGTRCLDIDYKAVDACLKNGGK